MTVHCIRSKDGYSMRGRRAGMTLLEVMIGLALLVAISLGFLYTAMGTVKLSRMTELEVAGTNAVSGQLDSVMTAAIDNSSLAHGTAKGIVLYLKKLEAIVGNAAGKPVRVALDSSSGILYYEFPVAAPGAMTSVSATDSTSTLEDRQYPLAKGVMMVYLREKNTSGVSPVPGFFYSWNDLNYSSTGEDSVPSGNSFFDMDGDGENTGDFTGLFTGAVELYPSSPLVSIPVTIMVRYYSSTANIARDANGSLPGFADEMDSSSVSLVRHFIINNDSVIGLGIF